MAYTAVQLYFCTALLTKFRSAHLHTIELQWHWTIVSEGLAQGPYIVINHLSGISNADQAL